MAPYVIKYKLIIDYQDSFQHCISDSGMLSRMLSPVKATKQNNAAAASGPYHNKHGQLYINTINNNKIHSLQVIKQLSHGAVVHSNL